MNLNFPRVEFWQSVVQRRMHFHACIPRALNVSLFLSRFIGRLRLCYIAMELGAVTRNMISSKHRLRTMETYTYLWQLTLVSACHASSNSGLIGYRFTSIINNQRSPSRTTSIKTRRQGECVFYSLCSQKTMQNASQHHKTNFTSDCHQQLATRFLQHFKFICKSHIKTRLFLSCLLYTSPSPRDAQ